MQRAWGDIFVSMPEVFVWTAAAEAAAAAAAALWSQNFQKQSVRFFSTCLWGM